MKTISTTVRERLAYKVEASLEGQESTIFNLAYALYENMDSLVTYYQQLTYEQISYFSTFIYLELATYYGDLYLILNQKKKELQLRKEDYPVLDLLYAIESYDDLVAIVSSDPSFLEEMMRSSLQVHELAYLGKVNLYHKLEQEDIDSILHIFPVFIEEVEKYKQEIEPIDYVNHFEAELEKCITMDVFPNLDGEHILTELCGFLKGLSAYDYENYSNNVIEMASFHYEYLKYLTDFHYEVNMYTKEEMQHMIAYFESVSLFDLATDLLYKDNYDYLRTIVEFYVQVYPRKKIFDNEGREISYREVCHYTEKNEKVKEKIKK